VHDQQAVESCIFEDRQPLSLLRIHGPTTWTCSSRQRGHLHSPPSTNWPFSHLVPSSSPLRLHRAANPFPALYDSTVQQGVPALYHCIIPQQQGVPPSTIAPLCIMNQPVQGNQPQEQGIVVIYLMDSDSSDEEPDSEEEPAEREPHPAGSVDEPLEDTRLPHRNRQDFWEHVEQPSRLFEDPDSLPEPLVKRP
jgi:hypothetical protein